MYSLALAVCIGGTIIFNTIDDTRCPDVSVLCKENVWIGKPCFTHLASRIRNDRNHRCIPLFVPGSSATYWLLWAVPGDVPLVLSVLSRHANASVTGKVFFGLMLTAIAVIATLGWFLADQNAFLVSLYQLLGTWIFVLILEFPVYGLIW